MSTMIRHVRNIIVGAVLAIGILTAVAVSPAIGSVISPARPSQVAGTNETASTQAAVSLDLRINSAGIAIVQSGYQTNFTLKDTVFLVDVNNGDCLFSGVSDYYEKACNDSQSATWGFGSNNTYSVMYTSYNEARGDCAWGATVAGTALISQGCDGSNNSDRWNWHS